MVLVAESRVPKKKSHSTHQILHLRSIFSPVERIGAVAEMCAKKCSHHLYLMGKCVGGNARTHIFSYMFQAARGGKMKKSINSM